MQNLIHLAIFIRAAEKQNFTAVAHELGLTPSAVSRHITALEDHLGVQLFIRSTRRVHLTDVGRQFYETCARGLREIERADELIQRQNAELRGWLRISATPCFGKLHIAPAIPDFIALHPGIQVDFSLGYGDSSFSESGVDILIRAAPLTGAGIESHSLAPIKHIICASPAYFERRGMPTSPRDLIAHNCLILSQPHPRYEWRLGKAARARNVRVSGNYQTNSMEALYGAALRGQGIARLPNYVVAPALRKRQLVAIFSDKNMSTNTMKAHAARRRLPDRKTQAFIGFLKDRFKGSYNWDWPENG